MVLESLGLVLVAIAVGVVLGVLVLAVVTRVGRALFVAAIAATVTVLVGWHVGLIDVPPAVAHTAHDVLQAFGAR
jgi:hypothetical protein